jgi:hypothetical protein
MLFAVIKDTDGNELGLIPLQTKDFTTGSRGYFGQAKVTAPDGARLQVQVTAVIIGSKETGKEGGA